MATTPWIQEHWPDFDTWLADLNSSGASERVQAIIGGTMLDLILRRMLMALMTDDAASEELLGKEDAGSSAPLSNFASRVKACRALGLISKNEASSLTKIGKIRNGFAHRLSDRISEASLDDHVAELTKLVIPNEMALMTQGNRREKLLRCLIAMAVSLAERIQHIERREAFAEAAAFKFWREYKHRAAPS